MRKLIKILIGALVGALTGILIEAIAIGMFITVVAILTLSRTSQTYQYAEMYVDIPSLVVIIYSSTIGGIIGGVIGELVGLAIEIRRIAFKGAVIGAIVGIIVGFIFISRTLP